MEVPEYIVHPGVRARYEDFGILLYNTADTRLTFVGCGTSIQLSFLENGEIRLALNCDDDGKSRKARTVLERLIKRGLIIETGTGL
jgi:putative mycofactocin binding protein MftB